MGKVYVQTCLTRLEYVFKSGNYRLEAFMIHVAVKFRPVRIFEAYITGRTMDDDSASPNDPV